MNSIIINKIINIAQDHDQNHQHQQQLDEINEMHVNRLVDVKRESTKSRGSRSGEHSDEPIPNEDIEPASA